MRYYIIAGEASGDLHGGNLVRGLLAEDPQADIRAWGGPCMEGAGAQIVRNYKDTAVMGVSDVIKKAGKLLGNLSFCKKDILGWKPDVVILIDYPGFNMKVAHFCHDNGIKVFYYIAPKTWASRESRNRKLCRWVDKLFIIFPFEMEYFTAHSVPFIYEGNPLLDAVDTHEYVNPAPGEKYIAVLPGSRKGEISRTMPVAMRAADLLDCKVIVAGAPSRSEEDYRKYIGGRENVRLLFGRTYDILKFADAAVINSGTASLEAALIGTPQVVCWSSSALTYWAAVNVLKVQKHIKYISLGNLIADSLVFRELIQDDMTSAAVASEIRRLTSEPGYRQAQLDGYSLIRRKLGGTGASRAIAAAMIQELNN